MRLLTLIAKPLLPSEDLDQEDCEVSGIYTVEVDRSISDDAKAASVALDAFHSRIAVNNLDDFKFWVEENGKVIEEDPNHEDYSGKDLAGNVEFITECSTEVQPGESTELETLSPIP